MMFKKQFISSAFAFAMVALAGGSAAQTVDAATKEKFAELETRFKAADKNADGKLTLEEAKAGMPRVADAFGHIDAEKKGYVTLDQIKALMIKNAN
jgi:Ca2+-binding EF-hand superfamily protein